MDVSDITGRLDERGQNSKTVKQLKHRRYGHSSFITCLTYIQLVNKAGLSVISR